MRSAEDWDEILSKAATELIRQHGALCSDGRHRAMTLPILRAIQADAIEATAKVCDDYEPDDDLSPGFVCYECADRIRKLKPPVTP